MLFQSKKRQISITFKIVNLLLFPIFKLIDYISPRLYMVIKLFVLKHIGVKFNGKPRFISPSAKFDLSSSITLGDRAVISENVVFLTHDYSFTTALISTGDEVPASDIALVKPIFIGSNVFIGLNSVILPGTIVSDNVIIGAGSVVRGEIPEFSVVIGNPCKIIKDIRVHARKQSYYDSSAIRND